LPAVADPTGAGVYWRVAEQHPLRCAGADAAKLSDFVGRRELHRLEVYTDYLRLWNVEHQLVVRISSTPSVRRTFLFERSRRDFTERDRLVLGLLRPHLLRLHTAATERRLAASLARASDAAELGWIVLGPGNRIEFATERAQSLFATFFGADRGGWLPEVVAAWLEADPTEPLAAKSEGRQLVVRRAGRSLLVADERSEADARLTPREREVLALVRAGLTTAEIAAALTLARGTVRRHLQNVYAKLGVGTRTAAVARAGPKLVGAAARATLPR
jgi:DNA-binding CsgD family transcriptional regulator